MAINLGANPSVLLILTSLELLLVLIPAIIALKIKKTSISKELKYMGFQKDFSNKKELIIKVITGILLGFVFFIIANYISLFFILIIGAIFGPDFVNDAIENVIGTTPVSPEIWQLVIFLLLQIFIVGPCEEGFFRGFLIKHLNNKLKLITSIIISSLIFALFHVPPFLVPISTIITFFGYFFTYGIILSLVFVLFKNSLIPGSIAHSLFNILSVLLVV